MQYTPEVLSKCRHLSPALPFVVLLVGIGPACILWPVHLAWGSHPNQPISPHSPTKTSLFSPLLSHHNRSIEPLCPSSIIQWMLFCIVSGWPDLLASVSRQNQSARSRFPNLTDSFCLKWAIKWLATSNQSDSPFILAHFRRSTWHSQLET